MTSDNRVILSRLVRGVSNNLVHLVPHLYFFLLDVLCCIVFQVQGDPGSSKFFLSLQDDLMRIFGSDKLDSMLQKFGLEEGEAIVHPWVNKALEKAQQKVEARNFDIRKQLLKFDDVMNDQRQVIFSQRKNAMNSHQIFKYSEDFLEEESISKVLYPPEMEWTGG